MPFDEYPFKGISIAGEADGSAVSKGMRVPSLRRSIGGVGVLRLTRAPAQIHEIQPVEDLLHERCDHMGSLRVRNGILTFRVQKRLVQALLHGLGADESRSLFFDELFKSARRSRMIGRSHVILLTRVAGQAFGGVISTVGRRFFAVSEPHNLLLLLASVA
jgi:hypothetical protein